MSEVLVLEGVVVDVFRGDVHEVQVQVGEAVHRVLARRSGRLITRHIRLLAGDMCTVEVSPFDLRRGRIVHRGPMRAA
jgi:translation initiation factor IF-1